MRSFSKFCLTRQLLAAITFTAMLFAGCESSSSGGAVLQVCNKVVCFNKKEEAVSASAWYLTRLSGLGGTSKLSTPDAIQLDADRISASTKADNYDFDRNLVQNIDDGLVLIEDLWLVFGAPRKPNAATKKVKHNGSVNRSKPVAAPVDLMPENPWYDIRTVRALNMEGF